MQEPNGDEYTHVEDTDVGDRDACFDAGRKKTNLQSASCYPLVTKGSRVTATAMALGRREAGNRRARGEEGTFD